MKVLRITAKDFDEKGFFKKRDCIFDGNIEIDEGLGCVKFRSIIAKGYIFSKAGSGIEAGLGIKAGSGIEAGLSISCSKDISCKYGIFAGICFWKEITNEDKTITCSSIKSGKVEFGILNILKGAK